MTLARVPRACWWWTAGAALAVAAAWVLTSPGGQARIGAHLTAAMGSGDAGATFGGTGSAPGEGATMPLWAPYDHGKPQGKQASRHPGWCSPNITALMAQGNDWRFYPPSEGDI